jgi:hypothetical protein
VTDGKWQGLGHEHDRQFGIVRSYEVHVDGLLSRPLLGYLRWSHCVQPEQSVVRLRANPGELDHYLQACSECGLTIERLTRLEPGAMTFSALRQDPKGTES